MKKILLFMAVALAMTFVSCKRIKSDSEKNESATEQQTVKNEPTIIGDWYGFIYFSGGLLSYPIAAGAPNHCYSFSFISFKEDGKLSLFGGVPNEYLPAEYKYKYVDKGDYYAITDEFDRQGDMVLQISELTDSTCVIRYNSTNLDLYVTYSRNPEKRRQYFERFFKGKLKDEYTGSNEWKIDKELYQMDL